MRDPDRIPEILLRLAKVWLKNPDLRLGQLIGNVIDSKYLYEVSDKDLIQMTEELYEHNEYCTINNRKGKFCPYNKDMFCQEGCCNLCEMYNDMIYDNKIS